MFHFITLLLCFQSCSKRYFPYFHFFCLFLSLFSSLQNLKLLYLSFNALGVILYMEHAIKKKWGRIYYIFIIPLMTRVKIPAVCKQVQLSLRPSVFMLIYVKTETGSECICKAFLVDPVLTRHLT